MREIKFRAWQKCHGTRVRLIKNYCQLDENNHFVGFDLTNNIQGEILCVEQFTGMKDVNGKEIYEGDILRGNGINGAVSYEDGMFLVADSYALKQELYDWEIISKYEELE